MTNFQGESTKQHQAFLGICQTALETAGWQIEAIDYAVKDVAIKVDFKARNRHEIPFYFECRGSWQGAKNGCERVDTLKRVIANGFLLNESSVKTRFVVLTSDLLLHGVGMVWLSHISRSILFDLLNPMQHGERLRWLAAASVDNLSRDSCTLVSLVKSQWKEENKWTQALLSPAH